MGLVADGRFLRPQQRGLATADRDGDATSAYTLPDVKNIRDCGGWKTQDGRRVRYGRLYRSGELNNVNPRRRKRNFTLSAASRAFFTDTLGIRTDLDLRSNTECDGMTGSPLGTNVVWRHIPSLAYARLDSPEGRKAFAKVFRTLLDERAHPALIHCRVGRDRAGTAVFLLNLKIAVEVKGASPRQFRLAG